jgi:4-hydroxy-3-polyprenylbenzoate decarboxylase
MSYKNLNDFIQKLDQEGELLRITEKVNTELEITEITDRFSKLSDGGKALLFENADYDFPVLINAYGSKKRIELALGVEDINDIAKELEDVFKNLTSPKNTFFDKLKILPELNKMASWMPKSVSGKGECQEIIINNPDINKLPVLKCWPADGGKFITLPMVSTKDPVTGIRNMGMYRMQILDSQTTGMHWHLHKTGARHYNEYKKKGEKMPVTVCLGGDPAYTYSATAPLPDNVDEYMLAGFIRKKKVELVKCITNDLEVPKDVDFVIEGYVDTSEDLIWEGPFGDHTGFYSLADWYPKFHITCITHRKNAIYPTTIVGIPPMEDAYIGMATESIFLAPIKLAMLPELKAMHLPFAGVAHNLTIIGIENTFKGHAQKVMSALWGAGQMMFNKILIVANNKTNVNNYEEIAQLISNIDIKNSIHFNKGPMDVLDHSSSEFAYGSKVCFDITDSKSSDYQQLEINNKEIVNNFSEIQVINTDLLKNNISIVIISISKPDDFNLNNFSKKLNSTSELSKIKFKIIVDKEVDVYNLFDITWVTGNNIDPIRDFFIMEDQTSIYIDATRKTIKDNFTRNWPNPVVSSDETIKLVDEKWEKYFDYEFIPSPSAKYKKMMLGNDAIID